MRRWETSSRSYALILGAGAACLIVAVALGLLVRGGTPAVDLWALQRLRVPVDSSAGQTALGVGRSGSLLGVVTLVLVAARAVWRRWSRALLRYAVLFVASVAGIGLQAVFQRPGPPLAAQDWTYPSGHVSVATAMALTAVLLSRAFAPSWRVAVLALQAASVLFVTASRVALGEHFLTDAIGAAASVIGIGLGAAVALRLLPAGAMPRAGAERGAVVVTPER